MKDSAMRILSPIKQFCDRYPGAFTPHGMRHLIFHADDNGLRESGAILRCGRKLLIDEDRFLAWLDTKNAYGKPT